MLVNAALIDSLFVLDVIKLLELNYELINPFWSGSLLVYVPGLEQISAVSSVILTGEPGWAGATLIRNPIQRLSCGTDTDTSDDTESPLMEICREN